MRSGIREEGKGINRQLQRYAEQLVRQIRMATAYFVRQMERKHGLQGAKAAVVQGGYGPEYQETMEGRTLRLWVAEDGPHSAVLGPNILGFVWVRLSVEETDRCIGAVVSKPASLDWVALPKGFGDLRPDGPILVDGVGRPGSERFLEVYQTFTIAAVASWAGRQIDEHYGGDERGR